MYLTITIRVAENAVQWDALAEEMLAFSGPENNLARLPDLNTVQSVLASTVYRALQAQKTAALQAQKTAAKPTAAPTA